MTATTQTTKTTPAADTAAAEQLLRDVAYVLKLTRRVKEEMTADRRAEPHAASRKAEGVLVA